MLSRTAVVEDITRNACRLPPCRMLTKFVLVEWNKLERVYDDYSRYMKSFTMAGTAEDLTVTMIARLLVSQTANAALVIRLIQVKESGVLHTHRIQGYRGSYCRLKQLSLCMNSVLNIAKEWRRKQMCSVPMEFRSFDKISVAFITVSRLLIPITRDNS